MKSSTITTAIGIIIGTHLLPRFLNKKKLKARHIDAYKKAPEKPVVILDRPVATLISSVIILSSALIVPFLILFAYPLLINIWRSEEFLMFSSNGQYILIIVWLFSGPLLMWLISMTLIQIIPSWRRYYAISTLESNLIMVKKLKLIRNREERLKRLQDLANDYDVESMSRKLLLRAFIITCTAFALFSPLYAMGAHSYTGISADKIVQAPLLSIGTKTYEWKDVNFIDLYVEETNSGHNELHMDIVFFNEKRMNIWGIAMPMVPTEDLIQVLEWAKQNNVKIEKAFYLPLVPGLRDSIRQQIKEIWSAV